MLTQNHHKPKASDFVPPNRHIFWSQKITNSRTSQGGSTTGGPQVRFFFFSIANTAGRNICLAAFVVDFLLLRCCSWWWWSGLWMYFGLFLAWLVSIERFLFGWVSRCRLSRLSCLIHPTAQNHTWRKGNLLDPRAYVSWRGAYVKPTQMHPFGGPGGEQPFQTWTPPNYLLRRYLYLYRDCCLFC